MRADEVEHAERLAVEVVVVWGGDTLCVSHVAVPGVVFVGGVGGCAVALPTEWLGAERCCVAVSTRSDVCAVLPAGVGGWLTLPDGSTRLLAEPTPASSESPEPAEQLLPLALGCRAHLCFPGLEIQVATVRLGRPSRRAFGLDAPVLSAFALSALTIASLMAVLSRLTPALGLNQDEQAESARVRLLHTYLEAATERDAEPLGGGRPALSRAAAAKPPARRSASPEAIIDEADVEAAPVEPTLGLLSTPPARDPIERRQQVDAARRFGIVGMLSWPELKDPQRKWQRHLSGDELALMQTLFNPDSPVYEGPGGLALGIGIGGGGKADVVELGAVQTAGEGQGEGLDRFRAAALDPLAQTPRAPAVRQVESIVSDPLAAATIRRAVHAERAALRDCHGNASGSGGEAPTSPTVRFVVLGNGRVEQVSMTHPELPASVRRCIERVFLGLSVPNPASRPVHVEYRVVLDS